MYVLYILNRGNINYLQFLPHYNRISFEIAHVNSFPLGDDIWMRSRKEPTNMSKKEASLGIVRIRISFAVLVMNSMIQSPCVHVSLFDK